MAFGFECWKGSPLNRLLQCFDCGFFVGAGSAATRAAPVIIIAVTLSPVFCSCGEYLQTGQGFLDRLGRSG